jgi:hypothetical protein
MTQATIRLVTYFYTRIEDKPGNAYQLLARLASEEINLLAFSAVPFGPNHIELTLFPDNSDSLLTTAQQLGLTLGKPQHAFLIQGDDRLGAIADIHQKLFDAHINIYASSGVTDGRGHYGYLIYVKEQDFEAAAKALEAKTT